MMEVRKLVRVHLFVLIAIQLTLVAEIGSGVDTSPETTEVSKCDTDVNSKMQTMCGVPHLEKYISELYFQKYDSLSDSDFQDFIAEQLFIGDSTMSQGKCSFVPRLSSLQRHLIGEGSHRRLSSSLMLSVQPKSTAELPKQNCKLIIIERLPLGVFADPFELQHLVHRGVITEAAVFGDTNLELPSVASNRSIVEIHMDVGRAIVSGGPNNETKVNIEIPLHARYAPLEEAGFSRVEFQKPDVFIHCRIEGKPHGESCIVNPTCEEGRSQNPVWNVPCGTKEHSRVISSVTFISAVVSAAFIVMTSVYYPHFQKSKVV